MPGSTYMNKKNRQGKARAGPRAQRGAMFHHKLLLLQQYSTEISESGDLLMASCQQPPPPKFPPLNLNIPFDEHTLLSKAKSQLGIFPV